MKTLVLLLGAAITFCTLDAQQRWDTLITLYNTGSAQYSFVNQMDNKNPQGLLSIYGGFKGIAKRNAFGNFVHATTDSNAIKYVDGTWTSAGKIHFTDPSSSIVSHTIYNNQQFIGITKTDSIGTLASIIQKLDPNTNIFVPLQQKHDAAAIIVPIKYNTFFEFGDFYNATDKRGIVKPFQAAAIWDKTADTLGLMPDTSDRTNPYPYGLGGYESHSISEKDGSVFIIIGSGYGFRVMHYGSTDWQESKYPHIPASGKFIASAIVDSNQHVYAIWQSDNARHPCSLMKIDNGVWKTLGTLLQ